MDGRCGALVDGLFVVWGVWVCGVGMCSLSGCDGMGVVGLFGVLGVWFCSM